MSDDLCEYEKQRLENIARNQAVLEALGLVQSDAVLQYNPGVYEVPTFIKKLLGIGQSLHISSKIC